MIPRSAYLLDKPLVCGVPVRGPSRRAAEGVVLHQPQVRVHRLHFGVDGLDVSIDVVDAVGIRH